MATFRKSTPRIVSAEVTNRENETQHDIHGDDAEEEVLPLQATVQALPAGAGQGPEGRVARREGQGAAEGVQESPKGMTTCGVDGWRGPASTLNCGTCPASAVHPGSGANGVGASTHEPVVSRMRRTPRQQGVRYVTRRSRRALLELDAAPAGKPGRREPNRRRSVPRRQPNARRRGRAAAVRRGSLRPDRPAGSWWR
jgi:hypothetical protein